MGPASASRGVAAGLSRCDEQRRRPRLQSDRSTARRPRRRPFRRRALDARPDLRSLMERRSVSIGLDRAPRFVRRADQPRPDQDARRVRGELPPVRRPGLRPGHSAMASNFRMPPCASAPEFPKTIYVTTSGNNGRANVAGIAVRLRRRVVSRRHSRGRNDQVRHHRRHRRHRAAAGEAKASPRTPRGASSANPKISVVISYVGNWDDVSAGKEQALAQIARRARRHLPERRRRRPGRLSGGARNGADVRHRRQLRPERASRQRSRSAAS